LPGSPYRSATAIAKEDGRHPRVLLSRAVTRCDTPPQKWLAGDENLEKGVGGSYGRRDPHENLEKRAGAPWGAAMAQNKRQKLTEALLRKV